ncbi:MAG: glycosyltransferase [Planctomycetota bacterium]
MSQTILFTVEHLYPFGDGRMLLPLSRELVRRGLDVVVVVLGQATFSAEQWRDAGIRIFFANGDDKTPLHTSRDAFHVIRELRSVIRIVEPNLVHAWCGESIWLTLLAVQEPMFTKPLPKFRFVATELAIREQTGFARKVLENFMASQLETLIVPHEVVSESMTERGMNPDQFLTIPNAYVRHAFDAEHEIAFADRGSQIRGEIRESVREQMDLPKDAKLVVAIADLVPKTRLKDLVWATDLLVCIRDDFHFAIIGRGPQKKRLQRFAAQTEAKPNVHFCGLMDSPDRLLAAADVYWHAHLQQPLPVSLLTAMSMGVPAISVYGPGTSEVIRHQETGFGTNFGARDEFARWTKFLLERLESGAQLARQGQNFVESNYTMDKMVEAYLDVYQLSVARLR